LIRRTIGIRRFSSRWFFDPKIFFKIHPTISILLSARFGHLSFRGHASCHVERPFVISREVEKSLTIQSKISAIVARDSGLRSF
jgi:hypothetical protein